MLTLKPTGLGQPNDYEVLDPDRAQWVRDDLTAKN
jgi:hypothetical protein